jgi:DNA modification methylase
MVAVKTPAWPKHLVEVTQGTFLVKNSIEIQYLPIGRVTPSPHRARVHNSQQRRKLESVLRRFGQVAPIIVDMDNVIVDGHAIHEGLRELGYDEIAVITVLNRTPAEIRALRLALNRIPQDARWDNEQLRAEFETLLELGFDLDLTGFDVVEIDMALSIDMAGANTVEEEDAEDLEPRTAAPVAQPGDVWQLGDHVVGCGDARDAGLLTSLVGNRQAAVVFTDPPYNVRIDGFVSGLGKTHHREFAMAAGEMQPDEFAAFLGDFIVALKAVLADGAILYVCMDWRHIGELTSAARQQELEFKNLCVWVKSNAGMGSFYRSQHELVFVFKHGTGPHRNNFGLGERGRTRSNVWQYRGVNTFGKERMELLGSHPTVKPVTMIADALRDVSRRGDLVVDPFLGSGSTLIAAEDTGRVCVGVEFDPGYVDVAIRRWQKRTGKDAVHAATGELFNKAAERAAAARPSANDATG